MLTYNGKTALFRTVDEAIITKHSIFVRNAVDDSVPGDKTVFIRGASPGPLTFVLDMIVKNYSTMTDTTIRVHKEPLTKCVMVYEALEVLQVDPPQGKVEGHITGYVAHHQLTPDEMVAVHRVFEAKQNVSRAWPTMVHQIGWDHIHAKYTEAQAEALQTAARQYPSLHNAIDTKITELSIRRGNFQEASAKANARRSAKKEKKEIDNKAKSISRSVAQHKRQQKFDETHGLKAATEETVEWAMKQKPGSYYFGSPKKELRKAGRTAGKEMKESSGDEDEQKSGDVDCPYRYAR